MAGATSDQSTLETALLVARLFDGHLDALHVRLNPAGQMPLLVDGQSVQGVQQLLNHFQKEIEDRANTARGQFDAFLKANQVKLC